MLGLSGRSVKDDLDYAKGQLQQARTATLANDVPTARAALERAQTATARARNATDGWAWTLVGAVPVAGDSVDAARAVAQQADVVARDVLPPLLDAAQGVDPSTLRKDGSTIDLAAVRKAATAADAASAQLDDVRRRLAQADSGFVVGAVANPLHQVRGLVDQLAGTLRGVRRAADLMPAMLGADGPRRYFLAFQNPAEARGTGGLIGAYGILQADHGKLSLERTGTDAELQNASTLPIDLGPDYRKLYGDDPALWQNVNESPDWPKAGQLIAALWKRQHGEQLDGAIAVDPVVLSYLLQATGPVTAADGTRVTAQNVVELTMKTAYDRFGNDKQRRGAFLVGIADAVSRQLFSGAGSPRALLDALDKGGNERRVLVWSAHPEEQQVLEDTYLSGALPQRPGPWAMVVLNNTIGSKLDYYLDRSVTYAGGPCSLGVQLRETTVSVTLHNTVPADAQLPTYVTGAGALPKAKGDELTQGDGVYVFGPLNAYVSDVQLDGSSVPFAVGQEDGHPVAVVNVRVPTQQRKTMKVFFEEPTSAGPARVAVQPLVRPQTTSVRVAGCR